MPHQTARASTEAGNAELLAGLRACRERIYQTGRVPCTNPRGFPASPSGLDEPSGCLLRDLVVQEGAATTIETGFALGLSAMFLIEGALCSEAARAAHTAVDPFQTRDWLRAGECALGEAGVGHLLTLIEQDSAVALPRLADEGRRYDFGFVDGGHLFENALIDVCFMQRLVAPEGLVVVDDVWMPAVRAAVRYATTNLGLVQEGPPPGADERAARRMAILRTPACAPDRPWDHFVPF
jgi:predicted O-methyltransferase YrrM